MYCLCVENLELGFCKDEQENKIKKKTKCIHPWHLQYMNENYNWSVSQRPKTGLKQFYLIKKSCMCSVHCTITLGNCFTCLK